MVRFLVFSMAAAVCVPAVRASEEDAALRRIQEEVANRRKLRQRALDARGVVFAPMEVSGEWLSSGGALRIDAESLGLCGQTFATLTRKEVMVSGRIVKKEITLDLEHASIGEAEAAFRKALAEHGVAIVPVGQHILALVADEDVAK